LIAPPVCSIATAERDDLENLYVMDASFMPRAEPVDSVISVPVFISSSEDARDIRQGRALRDNARRNSLARRRKSSLMLSAPPGSLLSRIL
jgi:hypothetical protein